MLFTGEMENSGAELTMECQCDEQHSTVLIYTKAWKHSMDPRSFPSGIIFCNLKIKQWSRSEGARTRDSQHRSVWPQHCGFWAEPVSAYTVPVNYTHLTLPTILRV